MWCLATTSRNRTHPFECHTNWNGSEMLTKSTAQTSVRLKWHRIGWGIPKLQSLGSIHLLDIVMLSLGMRTGLFMYIRKRKCALVCDCDDAYVCDRRLNVAAHGAHQFANVQKGKKIAEEIFSTFYSFIFIFFLCYSQHSSSARTLRFSCAIKVLDWAVFATFFRLAFCCGCSKQAPLIVLCWYDV